jgi:hypothetical protein
MRIALIGAALAAPAAAQQVKFSATVRGELGYRTNPFLRPHFNDGSVYGSGSVAPQLTYETERSTTALRGDYERDEYFTRFGHTESLLASLQRVDRIRANLTSTLAGSYRTSNRVRVDLSEVDNEPLNVGRRTHQSEGSALVQWQATAQDQLSAGAQIRHLSYGNDDQTVGVIASNYTQYAGNVGYTRVLDARTTIGVQGSVSETHSRRYPNSRAFLPSVTFKRQLSAIWTIDGNAGVVLQHIYGPFSSSHTSFSYGLNLCGAYPRTQICVSGQRQTTPSGYGALRTHTGVSASLTEKLTEQSRIALSASYYKSNSSRGLTGPQLGIPSHAKALTTHAEYDRDLSERISAGFGGLYQSRSGSTLGAAHTIGVNVHVTAKLGRI